MTRKTFGLLVFAPVVFFLADKFTGIGGGNVDPQGGEKGKKKSRTSPSVTGKSSTQVQVSAETPGPDTTAMISRIKPATKADRKAMKSQMEAFLSKAEDRFLEQMAEYDELWPGKLLNKDKEIHQLIEKKLKAKLNELSVFSYDPERAFSRCPSGLTYMVFADTAGNPLPMGWLFWRPGCAEEPVAEFTYSKEESWVKLRVSEEAGYLAVEDWAVLYKEIN